MKRVLMLFIVLLIALAAYWFLRRPPSATQEELDARFKEMMQDATLVGRSTRLNDDKVIGEERYVIESVTRLTGETWLFKSRLQYGSRDIPIPMPVTIKWAGDTPVITLTDFAVPGMGTYTARVLFYRDQYAGTWSGKNGGGQIFGKIVRGK